MSQHFFSAKLSDGQPVCVITGWDRPTQEYFLIVEIDDEMSDVIYSDESDLNAKGSDWNYYEKILKEFGITPPAKLSEKLFLDKQKNTGNEITNWSA